MKQELISTYDWSALDAFRHIDEYSHGKINNDKYDEDKLIIYSLRCFMRRYQSSASLDEDDLTALLKKSDRDIDGAWSFKEFVGALTPRLQFSVKAKDLHKVQISSVVEVNKFNSNQDNYGEGRSIDGRGTTLMVLKDSKSNSKENMRPEQFSKASRSTGLTSPHSHKYLNDGNSRSNMRNIESALDSIGGNKSATTVL